MQDAKMIFAQIKAKNSDNYSYILGDDKILEIVIVDPSYNAECLIDFAKKKGLSVKYVINTHSHRDHTLGNKAIVEQFDAKIVAHSTSKIANILSVEDGTVLNVGEVNISIIHTPGHSPDSICLLVNGKVLTGDTLFVGECGRTDIPGGNSTELYYSLFDKLMRLNDDIEVYPGHQYRTGSHSSIGHEKRTNYILAKRTVKEFIEFIRSLFSRSVWISLDHVDPI
jgi:glyoxylase-like metal-dependent hydrolase (beta-lactamase superfamily II)